MMKDINDPFGWIPIKIPGAVAVILGKHVMVIVIGFTTSEDGQEKIRPSRDIKVEQSLTKVVSE